MQISIPMIVAHTLHLRSVVFLKDGFDDNTLFVYLIHEGDCGYNVYTLASFHENIDFQDTQLQPQTESTTKKNFTKRKFWRGRRQRTSIGLAHY